MPLPQKGPREGASNRRVHFPFICTPRGGCFRAWIAGPCHWFDCHTVGRSKPCLCEMTGGELECDKDHDIDEPRTIGYQPLFQCDNGRPGFVIVYDYARDQIDALKHRFEVMVSRGKGKSDTVAIVYERLTAPLYHSSRADLMRPADLTESLLRIWKMPELTCWYRQTHGLSDNAVSPEKKPVPKLKPLKSNGQLFDKMHQAAAEKYDATEQGNMDGSYAAVLRQAKSKKEKHRKNGHIDTTAE